MVSLALHQQIRSLVATLEPVDGVEAEHRQRALDWVDSTDDLFRRAGPRTPDPHLVSYFLLVDPDADCVLLVDHIKAGLWLPSGGHVEPGEHPITTVHREVREELGVDAEFLPKSGDQPVFIMVTETAPVADRHTDVSLWFALRGRVSQHLSPDPGEFHVRWWTRNEIADADPENFDPHLARMLDKFDESI